MKTYNFGPYYRGDTFPGATFQVLQDAVVIDLTGYTIAMQLRTVASSSQVVLDVSDEIEIHDPTQGRFRINAFDIDIAVGAYRYDIEFTSSAEVVSTWVRGVFTVEWDVTRA